LLPASAAVDGRVEVEIGAASTRALIGQLAGFGAMVEVTEPAAFRTGLSQIGAELVALYGATLA
jgi:predicted DNA-binding transcriptional regulator YafY